MHIDPKDLAIGQHGEVQINDQKVLNHVSKIPEEILMMSKVNTGCNNSPDCTNTNNVGCSNKGRC
jgi:hypothetical protein